MAQLLRRIFSSPPYRLKMVLVVRDDLKMSKGKTAAQCAHAAILCYEECLRKRPELLTRWCAMGQPKIVLKAADIDEVEKIYKKALESNVIAAVVRDAGRTQLDAGTLTVLGLGPDSLENMDGIAKHLQLL